jgi:hypothetical protein
MIDETETLRRIIADAVQNELRYATADSDLFAMGRAIANEVMRRLEAAGIKAVSE